MSAKPLFIPLKREYFEAFRAGEKSTEYRPWGPRWNDKTCPVGRRVTLSLGYGKSHRLYGTVTSIEADFLPSKFPGWTACYGTKHDVAACIGIKLDSV